MGIDLQQILDEADTIVPNEFSVAMKVSWINNVNHDFFNVVKIPKVHRFNATLSATYTLPTDVRQKNIDLVMIGVLTYRDLDKDNVVPLQNNYDFDDSTHTLTVTPAPYTSGLAGVVRYRRIATSTYTSSNLNAVPDAPDEYQWTYIPALCEYICLAMDDPKAASFNIQKTNAWNVAAQNYTSGGAA